MRMIVGLAGLVVCGTALMASCTVLYCPVPSAATVSVVGAAQTRPAPMLKQTSRPNIQLVIVREMILPFMPVCRLWPSRARAAAVGLLRRFDIDVAKRD